MATGIDITTPGSPNGKVVAQDVGSSQFVQSVKNAPQGLTALGAIQALTVAASAVALPSPPSDAEYAFISLETAAIRWADDGSTTISASVGHLLSPPASDSVYFMIEGRARVLAWRGIRVTGTSGALQVTYYKAVVPT